MPTNQRMRHYPMSHRGYPGNSSWATWDGPTLADFTASTHFDYTLVDERYAGDTYDHMWQRVYDPGRLPAPGFSLLGLDYDTNVSTWWPGTGGYYFMAPGSCFFTAQSSISQPLPTTSEVSSRRTVYQPFRKTIIVGAGATLQWFGSGVTYLIGTFTINKVFGQTSIPPGVTEVGLNLSTPRDYDSTAFVEDSVLPTIWHQGVEGEAVYTVTTADMNPLLYQNDLTFGFNSGLSIHTAAVAEFNDVRDLLYDKVNDFTGSFEIRSCATPWRNEAVSGIWDTDSNNHY